MRVKLASLGSVAVLASMLATCSEEVVGPAPEPPQLDVGADISPDLGEVGLLDAAVDTTPEIGVEDTASTDASPDEEQADQAPVPSSLRVIHATPSLPEVEARLDGREDHVGDAIGYGEATDWAEISPGSHTLEIFLEASDPREPLIETDEMIVPPGAWVTAVVAEATDEDPDRSESGVRVLLLTEDFQTPPAGRAVVRVVHASPDMPAFRLDLHGDGTFELAGVERYGSTSPQGATVLAGEVVRAQLWSTDDYPEPLTAFTLPPLEEGDSLLLVVSGLLKRPAREPDGLVLTPVGGRGALPMVRQDPRIYVLHVSPNAPALEVFSGNKELVADLAFGEISAPIQLAPGSHALTFFAATPNRSTENPPLETEEPLTSGVLEEVEPGQAYLAVVTGFVGTVADKVPFHLLTLREGFDLDDSLTLARLIHAAPEAGSIDVGVVLGEDVDQLVDHFSLDFGASSLEEGLGLPLEPLMLAVMDDTGTAATFELRPQAGMRLFLVVAGTLAQARAMNELGPLRLFSVDASQSPWALRELVGF